MATGLPIETGNLFNLAVELDIFSGRPNPSWTLRTDDQNTLVTLLRENPVAKTRTDAVPPLGYRGVIIRITSDHGLNLIHVFDGTMESDGRVYRDTNRAIERFIINTMPQELKERFKDVMPNLPP